MSIKSRWAVCVKPGYIEPVPLRYIHTIKKYTYMYVRICTCICISLFFSAYECLDVYEYKFCINVFSVYITFFYTCMYICRYVYMNMYI